MLTTMDKSMLPCVVLILLLLCSSSGRAIADGFEDGMELTYPSSEVVINKMKVRKLIGLDAMLDYDPTGANPAHEPPKKGSPGGKG